MTVDELCKALSELPGELEVTFMLDDGTEVVIDDVEEGYATAELKGV